MVNASDFARARLDEDSSVADSAQAAGNGWGCSVESWNEMTDKPWRYWDEDEAVEHIAHWSPVSVLADIAAKRKLLALWDLYDRLGVECGQGTARMCLASAWSDHPDYDPAWNSSESLEMSNHPSATDLMSRDAVAAHLGIAPQSVRTVMARYGITEVRGYPADQVRNLRRKPRGRTPQHNP